MTLQHNIHRGILICLSLIYMTYVRLCEFIDHMVIFFTRYIPSIQHQTIYISSLDGGYLLEEGDR